MAKKKPDFTPSGIIDLDTVVIGVIKVRLRGKEYDLPDQVPLDVALDLMHIFDKMSADSSEEEIEAGKVKADSVLVAEMFSRISRIFVYAGYNDMVPEVLNGMMTLQQGSMLMKELMGRLLSQQEEAGNP